jgi:hypothetical protein
MYKKGIEKLRYRVAFHPANDIKTKLSPKIVIASHPSLGLFKIARMAKTPIKVQSVG